MIYFDHNASSPLLPEARQAWLDTVDSYIGNPSSPHRLGSRADNVLDDARQRLARLLGCDPLDIIFTSGATESNNAVLHHIAQTCPGAEIWLSSIEHPSVLEPAKVYAHRGQLAPQLLPVSADGKLDLSQLPSRLARSRPALLGVMAANNETGVLQPWQELLELCAAHDLPFFCDATQWLGRLPASGLGRCDFLTGSAHKFGGPRGVGFLKCPAKGPYASLLHGGPQQEGRRAGTENLPAIVAMVRALEVRETQLASPETENRNKLKENFEHRLLQHLPNAEIIGAKVDRLWNTSSIIMPGDCDARWVVKLDKLGFAVSTGSACSSGKEVPSHVLTALGIVGERVSRALRFSSSWETSAQDWELLLEAILKINHSVQRKES